MRNVPRFNVSVSSEVSNSNSTKQDDLQEMDDVGTPPRSSALGSERRSRYSMNYQSYEATRIQPGEQTRRMLDYMFPGYQKRDPRNWYEMQTQTDLGFMDVTGLIGTELIEGEPIETYEDRKKSLGESLGDDLSEYEGSPSSDKKAYVKKGHRSSIASRAWEGPPIKMTGKSSHEGFQLEVDDYYHDPQTILVPRDIIEHQELKVEIVPDDQGIPKVVIYLGKKDEIIENPEEESTIVVYDRKESFNRSSSVTEEEESNGSIAEDTAADNASNLTSDTHESQLDLPTTRDSFEVVSSKVERIEQEEPETSIERSDDDSDPDQFLGQGQNLNNSVFLEPIKATGSHEDLYEEVIDEETKEPSLPSKEPTPPTKELTPPPREPTPPPREITPPPREITPPPREPTPVPREPTPPPREPTPPPREPTPPPRELTPPPKEQSPRPSKSISVATVSLRSSSPEVPKSPTPVPSEELFEKSPSPIPAPEPEARSSIPSQSKSHAGSPPDHLFGPLENYPNDIEESDVVIHHLPQQTPSPSRDEEDDHPLRLTDDYPPQYSPPPREASELSNWLEANILSKAKEVAAKSRQRPSPQKSPVVEQIPKPAHEPEATIINTEKSPALELEVSSSEYGKSKKAKAARFGDDETLPDEYKRPLEQRFSVYYPPPKTKKKKDVGSDSGGKAAQDTDTMSSEENINLDNSEEKAVDEWLDEEILEPAIVNDWIETKILSKAKKHPISQERPDSFNSLGHNDDDKKVDDWMQEEILKPAQVDNWVLDKIMKPGEKLSGRKRKSETIPVGSPSQALPTAHGKSSTPSPVSSYGQKSVQPVMSPEPIRVGSPSQPLPTATEKSSTPSPVSSYGQKSVQPVMSPEPIRVGSPSQPSPTAPGKSSTPSPVSSYGQKSVQPVMSPEPIRVGSPSQPPPTAPEKSSTPSPVSSYGQKSVQPVMSPEPIRVGSPSQPLPTASEKSSTPSPVSSYGQKPVQPIISPAPISTALSYDDDKNVDESDREIESWVTNELVEPAQVNAWVEKELVQPAQAEKWVDSKVIKQATAQNYKDGNIMEPAGVQNKIEKSILKPTRVDSQLDENQMKSPAVEPFKQDQFIETPKEKHTPKPVIEDVEKPVESIKSPEGENAPQTKYPGTLDREKDISLKDVKKGGEVSADEGKISEQLGRFQVPETYISDTNLMGPFQPHPDHPFEYPKKLSVVSEIPSKPKPMEEVPRTVEREETSAVAPTLTSNDQPEPSSVERKLEISLPEISRYPRSEESPTKRISTSLTSVDRKPALRRKTSISTPEEGAEKKTDRPSIFAEKAREIEKKDRPSILAKKAIESNNYLLRDDEEDYVRPKMNSETSLPGRRSKSISSGKKMCPLTNLFKKKRSSSEKHGASLFTPASMRPRASSGGESSGKHSASPLSSIDEEELLEFRKQAIGSIDLTGPGSEKQPDVSTKTTTFKTKEDRTSDQEAKLDVGEQPISQPPDDNIDIPSMTITTTTESIDFHGDVPVSKEISPILIRTDVPPITQEDISQPTYRKMPSKPEISTSTPQAIVQPPFREDTSEVGKQEKGQPKVPIVEPEELYAMFPKFSDYDEVMKNRPQPTSANKIVPDPPKRGLPIFPDYKQLTEPQKYSESGQPPEEQQDTLDKRNAEDKKGAFGDETRSDKDDLGMENTVPLTRETDKKDPKRISMSSTDYPESNFPKFQGEHEVYNVPHHRSQEHLDNRVQESAALQPTKSNETADTSCSTEPTRPGSGIPKFPDYNDFILETNNQFSRPDGREIFPQQQPASLPQSLSPQQQTENEYSRSASVPPIEPKHATSLASQQGSTIPQSESPPQLQVPSFKKHNYSHPDSPLQRVSMKKSIAEQSQMSPKQRPVSTSQPPEILRQTEPARPQHLTPPHITIKQRTTPQSPGSIVSPGVQSQQKGPYDAHSALPQGPIHLPYRQQQQQDHHHPPTRPPQNAIQDPSLSVKRPQEPIQHSTTYNRPIPTTYRQHPPSSAQLSAAQRSFQPFKPFSQQSPSNVPISEKEKSTEIRKYDYSEPEKPLPISPVRPTGLENEDIMNTSNAPKADTREEDQLSSTKRTSPLEPGGGIPRFPDFDTTKPTGDFSRTPQKPKTVTAIDKRAEFEKEIFPIMQQIQDLKRQMYELTPQKGPPMRAGPEHVRPIPTSTQLYNELEKRTMDATKSDREKEFAERRKQQYEANARRKIKQAIERSKQTK